MSGIPQTKREEKGMKTGMAWMAVAGLALAGGGCMSVNVGKPTVQTAIYKSETVEQGVAGVASAGEWAGVEQEGAALRVGLRGRAKVTERRADIYRELTVTKQKKMRFGIMPGLYEDMFHNPDELAPLMGCERFESRAAFEQAKAAGKTDNGRVDFLFPDNPKAKGPVYYQRMGCGAACVGLVLQTPVALFVTPFYGEWEPKNLHWWGPGIDAITLLSKEDQERLGINQCPVQWKQSIMEHMALIGFHRSMGVKLESRFVRNEPFTTERTTEEVAVEGPYEVEVEIPAIGYKRKQLVMEGETTETFYLPSARDEAGGNAEAGIRFYAAEGAGEVKRRGAEAAAILKAAEGNTFKAKVKTVGEGK